MAHYKVENTTAGALYSEYPHDPDDISASIAEFIETRFAEGWEFTSLAHSGFPVSNSIYFVFKANAQ